MSRRSYCDDWSCPARVSCANHFGRSRAYARMSPAKVEHGDGTPFDRHASEDRQSCANYKLDRAKRWLQPKEGDWEWKMAR